MVLHVAEVPADVPVRDAVVLPVVRRATGPVTVAHRTVAAETRRRSRSVASRSRVARRCGNC